MNEILGNNIMILRKENGLTQEQLASALGISFQAVSKWETGNSCPDISTLPLLADLFSVSVDQLIGRVPLMGAPEEQNRQAQGEKPNRVNDEEPDAALSLPWPDDDTFYAVLYHGHELIGSQAGDRALDEAKKHFVFQYEGSAQNIHSAFSVEIDGRVAGNVDAGGAVDCGDVDGDVRSNGSVNCGDVDGSVTAGGNVDCGDVDGDVRCGGSLSCGDVGGNANAGGNVTCDDVSGSVSAGSSVTCDDVRGNVNAGIKVVCDSVSGSVSSGMGVKRDAADIDLDGLDEMINEQIENSMDFSDLGRKINDAVQKAVNWSVFRGKGRNKSEDNNGQPGV